MSAVLEALLGMFAGARVFDLEQPRKAGNPVHPPHWPGYHFQLTRHHVPGPEPRSSASGFVYQAEHSGTHIDAFSHQAEAMKMFGGITVNAEVQDFLGMSSLGVETIAPIFRRGVLIDVAGAASPVRPVAVVPRA